MRLGRLSAYLLGQFRQWDRPSQAGFVFAVLLLVPTAVVAASGPENVRQPAIIGTMGLVMTTQVIIMWANRGMVTAFTKAQRRYLQEDFQGAREILEAARDAGDHDVKTLTLLGNTYRQLGMLAESEAVLLEASNNHPNHYFPQYGFGRTLLVQGRYAEAATMIENALTLGAPPVVHFDAGEAYYRRGHTTEAIEHLQVATEHIEDEPHRAMMNAYFLYRLGAGQPPSSQLIERGLAYWQTQARLFAHTAYGDALQQDLDQLNT